MRARATRLLSQLVRRIAGTTHREHSYSQDGEDRVLANMFREDRGYFVDVGAHHPQRFSNTYLFYERGWDGLNVDPLPGTKAKFDRARPRDTTIECGVDVAPGELSYYLFDEPAYNTFNAEMRAVFEKRGFPRSIGVRKVPVRPLAELLDRHRPSGRPIDFLSVDAEGWDLRVLQSNDWARHRPRVVVAEDGTDIETSLASPLAGFLRAQGYTLVSRTTQSVFWSDTR